MGGGETADRTPLGYMSLSTSVRFVLNIYRKTHTHTNPIRFGIFNLGHLTQIFALIQSTWGESGVGLWYMVT